MLYTLRKARFAELALALGCLLTVLSSLGLHPEPAFAGPESSTPGWNASARAVSGAHDCPICLAHRSQALNNFSPAVLEPTAAVAALRSIETSTPERLFPSIARDRAPPAA